MTIPGKNKKLVMKVRGLLGATFIPIVCDNSVFCTVQTIQSILIELSRNMGRLPQESLPIFPTHPTFPTQPTYRFSCPRPPAIIAPCAHSRQGPRMEKFPIGCQANCRDSCSIVVNRAKFFSHLPFCVAFAVLLRPFRVIIINLIHYRHSQRA